MKPLQELLNVTESAWPLVQELAAKVPGRCVLYAPSASAGETLVQTQVTTRSPMGAVVYHTGGISVQGGWLRILGSGSPTLTRTLPGWNEGRSRGCYLIADDAVGGFFAIDGGGLGLCQREWQVCYFSPKSLEWEPMGGGYTAFLDWACTDFGDFYEGLAWPGCEEEAKNLPGDRCFFFSPPLWAKECQLPEAKCGDVPVEEAWGFQMDTARQMNGHGARR